jgi:RNA 2',3'-cyclic 3'-phosphodiesterase
MTNGAESWRLFIAIELPAPVRKRLIDHIDQVRTLVPGARASWIREENLHLTLKFLGDIPPERIESVSHAIKDAAEASEPFEFIVSGCGAFPASGQPKVLWVGIEDPSSELGRLYQRVEENCERAGHPRERRSFHPHLTIARVRDSRNSRQLSIVNQELGFERERILIANLALFRSELRQEGSRHTLIARHALNQT